MSLQVGIKLPALSDSVPSWVVIVLLIKSEHVLLRQLTNPLFALLLHVVPKAIATHSSRRNLTFGSEESYFVVISV